MILLLSKNNVSLTYKTQSRDIVFTCKYGWLQKRLNLYFVFGGPVDVQCGFCLPFLLYINFDMFGLLERKIRTVSLGGPGWVNLNRKIHLREEDVLVYDGLDWNIMWIPEQNAHCFWRKEGLWRKWPEKKNEIGFNLTYWGLELSFLAKKKQILFRRQHGE